MAGVLNLTCGPGKRGKFPITVGIWEQPHKKSKLSNQCKVDRIDENEKCMEELRAHLLALGWAASTVTKLLGAPVLLGASLLKIFAAANDHANGQQLQVGWLEQSLKERVEALFGYLPADVKERMCRVVKSNCYNHKDALVAKAMLKGENEVLKELTSGLCAMTDAADDVRMDPVEKCGEKPRARAEGNTINGILREVWKVMSAGEDANIYGGGRCFRSWCTQNGEKHANSVRMCGERHYISSEGSFPVLAQLDLLTRWYAWYRSSGAEFNRLLTRVCQAVCSKEFGLGLVARVLMFYHTGQPLRAAINTGNASVADMQAPVEEYVGILGRLVAAPELLVTAVDSMWTDPLLVASQSRYGLVPINARAIKEAKSRCEDPAARVVVLSLLKAMAVSGLAKATEIYADVLPGGKFHNPTPELKAELGLIPAPSDSAERNFGVFDNTVTRLPLLSHLSAEGVSLCRVNHTYGEGFLAPDVPTELKDAVSSWAIDKLPEARKKARRTAEEVEAYKFTELDKKIVKQKKALARSEKTRLKRLKTPYVTEETQLQQHLKSLPSDAKRKSFFEMQWQYMRASAESLPDVKIPAFKVVPLHCRLRSNISRRRRITAHYQSTSRSGRRQSRNCKSRRLWYRIRVRS